MSGSDFSKKMKHGHATEGAGSSTVCTISQCCLVQDTLRNDVYSLVIFFTLLESKSKNFL